MTASNKLSLGIVTGSLSPAAGGLHQSVRIAANRLAGQSIGVSVYGLSDDQFEAARDSWSVPQLKAFPVVGYKRFGWSPQLMQALERAEHDVLHSHGMWFYPSYAVDRWGRRTGRPTIISPRGMLDEWAIAQSSWKKRLIRLLYEDSNLRRAGAMHALNLSEAESFRRFGLKNPIALIPNGVDLPEMEGNDFPPSGKPLGDGRHVLLFLGRIHPKKGIHKLIEAWHHALRLDPGLSNAWRVVIAGWDDGGHESQLKQLVQELGLASHIAFAGPLYGAEKVAFLRGSDAFILPSRSEGLPMTVLEAWSYELPVLMTAECNLTESFNLGAAFEVSIDPLKMARVLVDVLPADGALKNAGKAGRRLVAEKYTWSVVIDDLRDLYLWLAGGGARPHFIL
jgi:glycosyltransferase involved in cell wall biosynthesis